MSDMNIPPLAIELMLACYVSTSPVSMVGQHVWLSSAGRYWRAWLLEHDLIDNDSRPTPRGGQWVERILDTPLPESLK